MNTTQKSASTLLMLLLVTLSGCGKFTSKLLSNTTVAKPTLLSSGYFFNCALFNNSKIKCWGSNSSGQLGYESTENIGDDSGEISKNLAYVNLGTNRTVKQFSTGAFHSCAVLDNSTVKCWGQNNFGQLGTGDTNNRGDDALEMGDNLVVIDLGMGRTAKGVQAGYNHSCALLDNNTVKCWGENLHGQLGQESIDALGDNSSEMGDALIAINLGTGRTATKIATAFNTSCAILDDSTTKCWGDNIYGEVGIETATNVGDATNEMGDNLLDINFGTGRTAKLLSGGDAHMCAVLDDLSLKCWGRNSYGQLGQGSTTVLGDGGSEMGDTLPAIDLGSIVTEVLSVSTNLDNTCARLVNSSVKCWGRNQYGQLGLGSTTTLGDDPGEMGDSLVELDFGTGRTALQVSSGAQHSCALLDDYTVKCWGRSTEGQTGIGVITNIGDAASETGDNLKAMDL